MKNILAGFPPKNILMPVFFYSLPNYRSLTFLYVVFYYVSRQCIRICIAKAKYLEKPKRHIIWEEGVYLLLNIEEKIRL